MNKTQKKTKVQKYTYEMDNVYSYTTTEGKTKYRARKSVNGRRMSFVTDKLTKAKTWLKNPS